MRQREERNWERGSGGKGKERKIERREIPLTDN